LRTSSARFPATAQVFLLTEHRFIQDLLIYCLKSFKEEYGIGEENEA